jgi:hypothetical protein
MANIGKRLMGASAITATDGTVADVDIDGLVRRLLLFDKYVLVSVRLLEFPRLLKHLGYAGLRDLLSANLIEVRCECAQIAQVGQSGLAGDRILPPYTYKFNWIDAHDKQWYIDENLRGIREAPELDSKQAEILIEGIVGAIRPLPQDIRSQVYPAFYSEIQNVRLLNASTSMAIQKELGPVDFPLNLSLQQIDEDTFMVKNDIAANACITTGRAHRIVEAGIMGIAGLSQTIKEMEVYSALSGFCDEDLPLFRKKLTFLYDVASSQKKEDDFQRVITLAGLPQYSSESGNMNIEKLLKVRDSSEAREFRDWLASCGDTDEKEIKERVAGLRVRAGLKIGGTVGKSIRFLVTSLTGLAPLPVIGLGAGALDQVLDRILPRSGVAAFVNELYPSIFKRR